MGQNQDDIPNDPSSTVSDSEKLGNANDKDSASGNADVLEQAPGADVMAVDKLTERAILRKLDYRIVPMVMWVYLMNMMDRGMKDTPGCLNLRILADTVV